ncbi:acyl-CoA dehydrogenase family protein [Spirosoma utsteinense]|uniref:Alkylation response protein AidB-like acyl-CoA dehydrogenase n=1 Tax=Spirosoma utsteinense TaxID=2585773 RepID=A0ABR6WDY9_9BACT|nr:acyl-CoA dehydrogenase family protein [Spirosoma utsteinense]MBC3788616.1 alkylation response protein AidB-like acyl-CoA dehydrogenase [Spirosoma utsteinense]MBC3794747.1 alkylation response protein AidB-like acyl-CoA dehydrogenase [Spirosoma utsteinense]
MKRPSLYFTEAHDLFRQSVRQFIETEVVPHTDEWETNRRIPLSVFQRMGELGYLGLPFPEEFGGVDADFWYSVVFLEELARCGMGGFTTAVSVHEYMAINHISKAGSYALKQRYLIPAIAGEKVAALAITEPDTGSDVSAIRTTAILTEAGDAFIVNGAKTFISNGTYGDFATLVVKTGGATSDTGGKSGGLSLLVVDLDSVGITRTKLNKIGWHSSDTAEIHFDDVRVPADNLIGQLNKGFYYLMESLQLERLVAAVMAVSGAQQALDWTLAYLNEREAFGRKIGTFQAIRHKIADVATEIEMARQFVYHTCWLYTQGDVVVKECSMAKLAASEMQKRVVDTCLQFFGGYGYMEDYPIARAYRDVRVGTIAGGSSEIMREIISRIVVDAVAYKPVYDGAETKA